MAYHQHGGIFDGVCPYPAGVGGSDHVCTNLNANVLSPSPAGCSGRPAPVAVKQRRARCTGPRPSYALSVIKSHAIVTSRACMPLACY